MGSKPYTDPVTVFFSSLLQPWAFSRSREWLPWWWPLSSCPEDKALKNTEMNDRQSSGVVWKQNACLGRRSGVMSRVQAGYRSFPQQLPVLLRWSWLGWHLPNNTQVPTTDLRLASTLADFPSLLVFLQGWRSYLGMRKDEWTYLLKQKCPNKAQDHKSAIVNLGETKLPSTRIYLFCTNRELAPWKKEKKNVFWAKYTNFAIRNLSVLFLVAPKLRNIGHSWITRTVMMVSAKLCLR